MRLISLSLLLQVLVASPVGQSILNFGGLPLECPIDIPVSCTNTTPIADSCCFEAPGGILLQTQFWDYYPPLGDNHTFTLHGLWPDNCDGTYAQFCDNSLEIKKSVKSIIVDDFKDPGLYDTMRDTWMSLSGDVESLWVHEFNKHGTCMTTIRPKCYSQEYRDHQNVYDYFNVTVNLFKKLPTFDFLANAGIVPSTEKTYTKAEIAKALDAAFGENRVYFKCNRYNALQEVWYFHHLKGSARNEQFVELPSMMAPNCPDTGIHFYPKGWRPGNGPNPSPNPPSRPDSGKISLTGHGGCLISTGMWYQQGTCATFRLQKSAFGGYNLRSSRGFCGFDENDRFACNSKYRPERFQFLYNPETQIISYGNNEYWCLSEQGLHGPGKYKQTPIQLDEGDCKDRFQLKFN